MPTGVGCHRFDAAWRARWREGAERLHNCLMMTRSPREQKLHVLSMGFAALPFLFGLFRAVSSQHDLRMLWMAFASFLGAFAVVAIVKARSQSSSGITAPSIAAAVSATLLAGGTAFLLGARAGPGAWMVAAVFGLCWGASYALDAMSRPREDWRVKA